MLCGAVFALHQDMLKARGVDLRKVGILREQERSTLNALYDIDDANLRFAAGGLASPNWTNLPNAFVSARMTLNRSTGLAINHLRDRSRELWHQPAAFPLPLIRTCQDTWALDLGNIAILSATRRGVLDHRWFRCNSIARRKSPCITFKVHEPVPVADKR